MSSANDPFSMLPMPASSGSENAVTNVLSLVLLRLRKSKDKEMAKMSATGSAMEIATIDFEGVDLCFGSADECWVGSVRVEDGPEDDEDLDNRDGNDRAGVESIECVTEICSRTELLCEVNPAVGAGWKSPEGVARDVFAKKLTLEGILDALENGELREVGEAVGSGSIEEGSLRLQAMEIE
ncbi:hypothetical protein GALMADRAFT_209584 [Galerina marginata CBS 339.88]|uniref:Uncharacterized protein n=1 Tax=Galerina marginata (strain CBS 339.88) TaxID=685588 RepID=A0A067T4N7_GALM3|nr:hypothetical protein GALMADRAFT_209584 [Galerina marginata CBS 339.88]